MVVAAGVLVDLRSSAKLRGEDDERRAEQTPVWVDGEWKPQLRMPLSFGMDHRIIDGADGARFMSWIVEAIKNPMIMALEG